MFGLTPRAVKPDTHWLLYQADLVIEWHFLLLLALCVLMWRHHRPRESQLLLLAIVFQSLSYLPPYAVNWMARLLWGPLGGQNAILAIRPYLEGLCIVLATSLQVAVWWFLARAAFGDQPVPPELPDEK